MPSGPAPSPRSRTTRSNGAPASASSAARPSAASVTAWPSPDSAPAIVTRRSPSSSTTRTRPFSTDDSMPADRSNRRAASGRLNTIPTQRPARPTGGLPPRSAPAPTLAGMITVAPAPPLAAPRLRGLSIVLPCYDEAANVERAIAEAAAVAERVADAHEVIVVDDGSRDETRALAEARAARDPRVRVLAHENNRGYGAALRTGFAA